jgi:hypothetical protein
MQELEEVVRVLDFGAEKYAPNSWHKVEGGKERYTAALLRHLKAWMCGEQGNEGEHKGGEVLHLAQVALNALFLLYFDRQPKHNIEVH